MNCQKLVKILFFIFALLFLAFSFAFAQRTQLNYPQFPGVAAWAGGLADFFRYFYQILLAAGTILAFSFFVYGGFVFFTSFGSPSKMNRAKEMMTSALLGLFILFASYAILSTIDPALTIFNLRIFRFSVPIGTISPYTPPKNPPGCYKIPLGQDFQKIHDLEKEALEITNRLEPLVDNATSSIEAVYNIMEQCGCGSFTAECLSSENGEESWQCPALCPPDQGDPCPPGLDLDNEIEGLEENLSCSQEFINLLEDDFDLNLSDDQEEEITERIDEGLHLPGQACDYDNENDCQDAGCIWDNNACRSPRPAEGIDGFIFWLEGELNHDFTNDERRQMRELLENCFSVQATALEEVLRKLTERRLDFEKNLVKVGQCRQDITRQLWICSEAKDKTLNEDLECRELDFYCCP